MYTLRTVFKENVQSNEHLGKHYTFVGKLESSEEFERTRALLQFNDDSNIYAFVTSEGGKEVYPLRNGFYYFIMTDGGKTFDNLTR